MSEDNTCPCCDRTDPHSHEFDKEHAMLERIGAKMGTDAPTPPAAAPTLPPEVREAIDAAAKKINWRLNTSHYVDIAGIIRDALAPVVARLKEAERERDRYFATLAGALFAGHFDKLTVAELREPGEKLIAERDALRAEVERLQRLNIDAVRSIDSRGEEIADLRAQLAAAQAACHTYAVPVINGDLVGAINQLGLDRQKLMADKERLDTLRRLMGYTQDGSNQTVKLFEDDATRDFFIMAGRRTYMGGELRDAIDTAREGGAK